MLLPCTEILIVDHQSSDRTRAVACEYGARIVAAGRQHNASHYLELARHDWIFIMQPGESITEHLQASLYEWSAIGAGVDVGSAAFSVRVREQASEEGWIELPGTETRLVPRHWTRWNGWLPAHEPSALALEGDLLRFEFP